MFSHRSNNFYYTTLHLQIGDLSQEVGELREELQRIQVDQQTGSGQSQSTASAAPDVDVHDLSRDAAERLLVDCLTSKHIFKSPAFDEESQVCFSWSGYWITRSFCVYEAR